MMTSHSRIQRLVVLAASTALATGTLLPSTTASPAPAPSPSGAVTMPLVAHGSREQRATAVPAGEWVKVTDPPSGITAELPGKATVLAVTLDGKPGRGYRADFPGGGMMFTVHDIPGDQIPLEDYLQGFLSLVNATGGDPFTSSDVRKTTVDGRPALDARLATKEDGRPQTGFVRFIADDTHLVQALTFGPEADQKALKEMHERLLASISIP
ncbi:hypothetical protein [Streptomyces sp. NPDC089799]|uniref:hypothetical protein n=1 Tax=Streptomyces sp. NPDC089799 TaxID=3155066 RepID=UPI003423FA29